MAKSSIDINCDMGESYGRYQLGNDTAIMPYISSCNIACGFHAGDPLVISRTIEAALQHDLAIGAHPSYPDLQGFGRRSMQLTLEELTAIINYQVSALKGMVEQAGGTLRHIKPHGALYNDIAKDAELSKMMTEIMKNIGEGIQLVGLAGSVTADICKQHGIIFKGEFFADRNYESNGQLVSRREANAVLHDPKLLANRVVDFCKTGQVTSIQNSTIVLSADTICLHGDHPQAVENAQAIHQKLSDAHISSQRF
ncbi:MAG: 5-oxoprolinase subunit PxpA [Bacteroidota bacterium]